MKARLLLVTAVLLPACVLNPQPGPPVDPCLGVEQYLALCCAMYPQSASCRPATPVPTMGTPEPSPTPTASSTPTSTPTVAPTATPTPAPEPTATPAPPDAFACVDFSTLPTEAVPVFTGRPCRRRDGFAPAWDPGTSTEGCIRDWACKDGDERYRPVKRIGDSLWFGGPNGVHRCNDGEAPGPGYICDTGRDAIDAYGRPMGPDGTLRPCEGECITKDEGERWRHSSICAPVRCEATPAPTARPTVGPTPTPISGSCPPEMLAEVQWDVLRIALKTDRSTTDRRGTQDNPAIADTDIIVGSITPKMRRPYCPNDRVICELAKECQDELVGFPHVTQTLPGVFQDHGIVHNSNNAFITFQNLAPGETGRYEITACTAQRTHCTTSYVWVE